MKEAETEAEADEETEELREIARTVERIVRETAVAMTFLFDDLAAHSAAKARGPKLQTSIASALLLLAAIQSQISERAASVESMRQIHAERVAQAEVLARENAELKRTAALRTSHPSYRPRSIDSSRAIAPKR